MRFTEVCFPQKTSLAMAGPARPPATALYIPVSMRAVSRSTVKIQHRVIKIRRNVNAVVVSYLLPTSFGVEYLP